MDSYVSFLIKIPVLFFIFMLMMTFILLGIEVSDVSNYKQYVNYTIERNGGLTLEAMDKIKEYDKKHVHGKYEIISTKMGQKVNYGEKVSYKVKCNYRLYNVVVDTFAFDVKGEAVSQVRQ
ncbi:hypothetical protein GHK79_04725 [Enterococcus faecium]|uniref:hypothetical protein n=1 Tax=Enterococcus faecium TaxID=1352 RepID=UPI0019232579|nr:hypothetical protein [Enterococcus faecium]EHK9937508.1 hypothetical protein [Enterococcus faecium]EME3581652.1 hypothetical protein [Enterococcus faecium]MBL3707131.1 hypothetical protein [Enterococcus faecium]